MKKSINHKADVNDNRPENLEVVVSTAKKLLPCPFCGDDNAKLIELFDPRHGFRVRCYARIGCPRNLG